MRLALDTSLLRSVSTRRFFSMLLALEGEKVVVLPTVDKEMEAQAGHAAAEEVHRLTMKGPPAARRVRVDAMMAAKEGAARWWKAEKTRNDSAFEWIDANEERREEYDRAAIQLPPWCHRGDKQAPNDLRIIAEGLVWDVPILATNNFNSIRVDAVNRSIREIWGRDKPLVHRAESAVTEFGGGKEAIRTAAMCACVSDRVRHPALDARSLISLARNVRGGGLRATGEELQQWIEAEGPRWGEIADEARGLLASAPAARRTREAQTRATVAIRSAVRSTGYDPWR